MNKPNNWLEHNAKPGSTLEHALDAAYAAGPNATAAQRAQAVVRRTLAAEAGPPMYYDLVQDTPLGPLWIAVGAHGLVAIEYESSEESLRAYLTKLGGRPERASQPVAAAAEQVRLYLLGDSQVVDLPVDLSHLTAFQQRVLQETRRVPRGQVRTYMQIAKRIGQPKAVRAVGQALRHNPIPIVVPCHRVVASDGTLGGYGGKMRDARKLSLLKLEGVNFA
ncbi:MAG: methylated-DNA--[protein]-cysteine S-methyltransferase [Anaerolineales bacterium]|nr:methylated-DNA--[protein]-cysteine S-methyltransferase [Anaerolineales bacterium]